ncbi:MAG: citrate synthase [Alphaproteobacteria bacterium]|nr:citrate synthase [Alphaproteobacteria bacterium]
MGGSGLEGIVVAETTLSHVDGIKGELIVRGHRIDALAPTATYEGMAAILGAAGAIGEHELRKRLAEARRVTFERLPAILVAAEGLSVTEGLRVGLASIPDADGPDAAIALIAAMPVLIAGLARHASGLTPIAPTSGRASVADFLSMLLGGEPDPAAVRALETYLVTVADHGMNASTFTARVVASTGSGLASSVVAALGALKGPLHGGAPGPVLDMLDAVGSAESAPRWIAAELDRGNRLMGFGHRIYRTRDPRADVLKAALAHLAPGTGRLALATAIERAALAALERRQPERRLDTNVEFYTALLLEAVGLDRALFTPAFAFGRVLGWCAHVAEQKATGRLIRPDSRYVGPWPATGAAKVA